jgi:catechol 2,3-dioxygenase-like lactoylglutathione lyase family enzyme
VRGETFPVLLYHTNDIHKLHDQLNELNVEITFYQDEGFGWVFKFYDPFGNMWGVIQPKRNLPFDFGIGNVFVPVTNMPRAVAWYRNILGLKPDEKYAEGADPEERTVYAIRLEHVSLLLDSMQRETLKPSPNQLFTFETQSLREAYSYLKEKGVEFGISEEEILGNPNRKAFQFLDCEGNSLIMHQPH